MLRDPSLIPLSQQHHNGLALCVLVRRSLAGDASEENVARLARRAIDRYELELTNHFEIEEQTLFPVIESRLGKLPILAELLGEHREVERLVRQLRTSPSTELLEQLCKVLSTHIRREENELFQEIQQRLPREVLDSLGTEISTRVVRICL